MKPTFRFNDLLIPSSNAYFQNKHHTFCFFKRRKDSCNHKIIPSTIALRQVEEQVSEQKVVSVMKKQENSRNVDTSVVRDRKLQSSATQNKQQLRQSKMKRSSFVFSTRFNTSYRWKQNKTGTKEDLSLVGALEVKSEPQLDCHAKLKEKPYTGKESSFKECLQIWKELKLHKTFIEACDIVPPTTSCCGLIQDHKKHMDVVAAVLDKGWAKLVNKQYFKPRGYKISVYVWQWHNASGPGVTSILLLRFHSFRLKHQTPVLSNTTVTLSSTSTAKSEEPKSDSSSSLSKCNLKNPYHTILEDEDEQRNSEDMDTANDDE